MIHNDIYTLLAEIKDKFTTIEDLITARNTANKECNSITERLDYVNLTEGSNTDKIERIVAQVIKYNINIIPTSKDSNLVRSALVAELGDKGLKYWLTIRRFREDFEESAQVKRYNYLLKNRDKNTMTFGTIVNRYKNAIDLYNENNLKKILTKCITVNKV